MKIAECGFVYIVTNPKGKIYIGSTEDIEERWSQYRRYSCKGQIKLYNSLIKYKVENHTFEVLWAGLLIDMLKYEFLIGLAFGVLEAQNLNLRLPNINDKYSFISKETRERLKVSQTGKKHSEETKLKMRKTAVLLSAQNKDRMNLARLARTNFSKNRLKVPNQVKVFQYTLNNEFIKEWVSATLAGKELKIQNTSITACCNNKRKTAGKYIWKYY